MPYSFVIDRERRLVLTTVWGEITLETIMGHQDALERDAAFDPTFRQLADFTGVTKVLLDAEEIRTAATRRVFSPGSRRAIVTATAEVFGLARMYSTYLELYGGKVDLRVFTDKDEALRWLLEGPERAGAG
jgi:hypothetical protein